MEPIPLTLPPRWRWSSDPETGLLLRARPPLAGRSGVLPEVRLSVMPGAPDDFEWVDDDLERVEACVGDFLLEEVDGYVLDTHPVAYRRFAHRRGAHDLVTERWAWEAGLRRFLVEATCARADHAAFCREFEQVAESFDPDRWGVVAA